MDLRVKKTYKLLSDALLKLLEEKNFDEIKLTEICELAMVHKTTFYNHFNDKYDLLKYTLQCIQKDIVSSMPKTESLLEFYFELAKLYMSNIKEHETFYRRVLANDVYNLCATLLIDMFITDLENKIPKEKIPSYYVATFYVYGVFATINEWFKRGMKEDKEQMIFYLKSIIENNYHL